MTKQALLDLAGRWDEWAEDLDSPEAAQAVRECAADLREAVSNAA